MRYGPLFWTCLVVGAGIMAFGITGVFVDANLTKPRSLGIWLVGCLVAHDVVVAPAVFTFGRVLRRTVPSRARRAIQIGLISSGVFVVVSLPVLLDYGSRGHNPTHLPRDYATGLLVALVAVWVITGVTYAVSWWRTRT